MRLVRYSVAMSLDGYITDPEGKADWIVFDPDADIAEYFREFYAQFDIAIMGRKTYEIAGVPIGEMDTYVFSNTLTQEECKGATLLSNEGTEVLKQLRDEDGKDIWLFGGGGLFGSLAEAGLVDTAELTVMPVLLGGGTPVISGIDQHVNLKLTDIEQSYGSVITLNYELDN